MYVQPHVDHTSTANNLCAVTGNASLTMAQEQMALMTEKQHYSHPTLIFRHSNPAISLLALVHQRSGANPGKDYWRVSVSNDGGTTLFLLKIVWIADHSWRRFAFHVADYLTPTDKHVTKNLLKMPTMATLLKHCLTILKYGCRACRHLKHQYYHGMHILILPMSNNFGWKG